MEAPEDSLPGSAIAFPGMGPSTFAESAKFLLLNPVARKLVATADKVLGCSLLDRYREAEGDYSEYAQVAFLINCLALATWAEQTFEVRPDAVAGASFGGKAAAVRTGALSFEEAVWMTSRMARCEEDYFAHEHRDLVTHSFTRTPAAELASIMAELDERGVWSEISCHIDEDFFMLSLDRAEVPWLNKRLRGAGGLPLYTMEPPMHCSVFDGLRQRIAEEVLAGLTFQAPGIPLVADQDGAVVDSAEGVREMILDGYTRAVRWPDVLGTLRDRGVGRLLVCGPDRLFGRVRIASRQFEVVQADPRTAMAPRRRPASRSAA